MKGLPSVANKLKVANELIPNLLGENLFVFLLVAAVIPHRVGTERAATTSDLVKRVVKYS